MSKHLVGGRRKREGKCEYVKEEETRETGEESRETKPPGKNFRLSPL